MRVCIACGREPSAQIARMAAVGLCPRDYDAVPTLYCDMSISEYWASHRGYESLAGWLCWECVPETAQEPAVDSLSDPLNPDAFAPWKRAGSVIHPR